MRYYLLIFTLVGMAGRLWAQDVQWLMKRSVHPTNFLSSNDIQNRENGSASDYGITLNSSASSDAVAEVHMLYKPAFDEIAGDDETAEDYYQNKDDYTSTILYSCITSGSGETSAGPVDCSNSSSSTFEAVPSFICNTADGLYQNDKKFYTNTLLQAKKHYAANYALSDNVPVMIYVGLTNATMDDVASIVLPGIGIIGLESISRDLDDVRDIYENPADYPNYVMLAAHRGYWRYAPENSLEAFQNAVNIGADMVELDLKMTADNQIMVAHDFHLGRLTTVPAGLQQDEFANSDGRYLFGKMNFCDIRPDLCGGTCENCCSFCEATDGVDNKEALRLRRPDGSEAEVVPTLREAFTLLKGQPVLINLDKIDPGKDDTDKTYFFDSIYQVAQEKGVLNQIVVKQRIDKFSPTDLRASTVVDWSQWYFTPTAFGDSECDYASSLTGCLSEYFDNSGAVSESDYFNCPGVELIYLADEDGAFPDAYDYLKDDVKKNVIQFPAYPENSEGVWNPKQYVFSDIDARVDRRNDWSWLIDETRRPDLIISDRLEVLLEILENLNLRELE